MKSSAITLLTLGTMLSSSAAFGMEDSSASPNTQLTINDVLEKLCETPLDKRMDLVPTILCEISKSVRESYNMSDEKYVELIKPHLEELKKIATFQIAMDNPEKYPLYFAALIQFNIASFCYKYDVSTNTSQLCHTILTRKHEDKMLAIKATITNAYKEITKEEIQKTIAIIEIANKNFVAALRAKEEKPAPYTYHSSNPSGGSCIIS